MMGWFHSKIQSLAGALSGGSSTPSPEAMKDRLEGIRVGMLEALGSEVPGTAAVARRIRYATDVQTLWYLRGDLMALLAAREGENAAGRRIESISALFAGLLPRGLGSRRSPLNDSERSSSSF